LIIAKAKRLTRDARRSFLEASLGGCSCRMKLSNSDALSLRSMRQQLSAGIDPRLREALYRFRASCSHEPLGVSPGHLTVVLQRVAEVRIRSAAKKAAAWPENVPAVTRSNRELGGLAFAPIQSRGSRWDWSRCTIFLLATSGRWFMKPRLTSSPLGMSSVPLSRN
jgi:hypothetical protein